MPPRLRDHPNPRKLIRSIIVYYIIERKPDDFEESEALDDYILKVAKKIENAMWRACGKSMKKHTNDKTLGARLVAATNNIDKICQRVRRENGFKFALQSYAYSHYGY